MERATATQMSTRPSVCLYFSKFFTATPAQGNATLSRVHQGIFERRIFQPRPNFLLPCLMKNQITLLRAPMPAPPTKFLWKLVRSRREGKFQRIAFGEMGLVSSYTVVLDLRVEALSPPIRVSGGVGRSTPVVLSPSWRAVCLGNYL